MRLGNFSVIAVALSLAACGGDDEGGVGGGGSGGGNGGDGEAAAHYDRTAVEPCLKRSKLVEETQSFDGEIGQLATAAGEGEFRANFDRNELNIAFERNERDAKSREANLREFSQIYDDGYQEGLIIRRANAVWEWDNTPSAAEEQVLDDCLTQSQK